VKFRAPTQAQCDPAQALGGPATCRPLLHSSPAWQVPHGMHHLAGWHRTTPDTYERCGRKQVDVMGGPPQRKVGKKAVLDNTLTRYWRWSPQVCEDVFWWGTAFRGTRPSPTSKESEVHKEDISGRNELRKIDLRGQLYACFLGNCT